MDARTVQSMLAPAAANAADIAWLWWLTLAVCMLVFVAVVGAVVAAVVHSRRTAASGLARGDTRATLVVTVAVALSVVTLVGLFVADLVTSRAIQARQAEPSIAIRITGHQWWWDVEYDDPIPARRVRTANELRLARGQSARLLLDSADVIHSFWAPNLTGKLDLIPGRRTVLVVRPEREGQFRAQCAEFCGLQHAHMAMEITVESPEGFDEWLDRRRLTPPPPSDPALTRGRTLFEQGTCAMCHRVAGTTAGGRTAPDLTHVGSRRFIGAATLPNDEQSLRAWIENPHRFKPGNRMPPSNLGPNDRDAVVAYLRSLR
jgi:cytochrome c oxidase subunit 2